MYMNLKLEWIIYNGKYYVSFVSPFITTDMIGALHYCVYNFASYANLLVESFATLFHRD
jgi:hypothetical protein